MTGSVLQLGLNKTLLIRVNKTAKGTSRLAQEAPV